MRKLGDNVWVASIERYTESILCLECFGKKSLTVILGDDSRVEIPCVGCACGYDPPTGFMSHAQYKPDVRRETIIRIEVEPDKIEYLTQNSHLFKDSEVFDTEEEAEKRAIILMNEHNEEEKKRMYCKERPSRTWAWNVHYHRKQIRDAEKTIAYASEKLGIAKLKAKEKQGE